MSVFFLPSPPAAAQKLLCGGSFCANACGFAQFPQLCPHLVALFGFPTQFLVLPALLSRVFLPEGP